MGDFISAESALELKHIKLLRRVLWTVGSWPADAFGESMHFVFRIQKKVVPVYSFMTFLAELNFLRMYHDELTFLEIGHLYITFFLTFLTSLRSAMANLKSYAVTTREFVNEFHMSTKNCTDPYKREIVLYWEKVSYYFTYGGVFTILFGMVVFNALPAYSSYRLGAFSTTARPDNVTYYFSVYWTLPNFSCLDHFFFSLYFNFHLSYHTTICICGLDLLVNLIAFQIIGQLSVLKHKIETIPPPTGAELVEARGPLTQLVLYSEEENKRIREILLDIVRHHIYIARFSNDVSNIFGSVLGVNYFFQLIILCILLLECSKAVNMSSMVTYIPLSFIILVQLVQPSVVFEFIDTRSTQLVDATYCTPWESMDQKNQFLVLFFLARVQKSIQLTAMGIVPVGVQTMQAILKTTFSYYAMLNSMSE